MNLECAESTSYRALFRRDANSAPKRSRLARKLSFWLLLTPFIAVTTSWADSLPNFEQLVSEEGGAVVSISVISESTVPAVGGIPGNSDDMPEWYRRFFEQLPQNPDPQPRRGAGFGSGFIISSDGYVITNAHVVDGATEIVVGLNDRREYEAELVGSDAASDIAVLKLDAEKLPVVSIGDSDELGVGEWVLAIGSPFGFANTATQGIVSALSRSLPDDTYVPFIQTDVAVNPGNSGGPLFNTDGEVVGVNSQIYSRSGGYQGLSFAIPINVAMAIAEQLKEKGYATRGWLGVTIQNVDQALAESFGLQRPEGALVANVSEGSPAMKGGIKSGDIILQFNGRKVPVSSALPPLVGAIPPGDQVAVDVMRDGRRQSLDITIEALDDGNQLAAAADNGRTSGSSLGVTISPLNAQERDDMGVESGVLVADVKPGSAAYEAGLRTGDIIVSINNKPIDDAGALRNFVDGAKKGKSVPILIHRDGAPMFLAMAIPE